MFPIRPRRNRRTAAIRNLIRETSLSAHDFILPLFVHEEAENTPISSLPGLTRYSIPGLVAAAGHAFSLGIQGVVLFPKIEESLKTPHAEEAYNEDGLIPRAIEAIKAAHPQLTVITDVALDPYSSDGHDGLVARDPLGEVHILNDETVEVLIQQALCHARAGADIISPSDMMDGRVAAIRTALDDEGFDHVSILAYTAKYASAFYGPFRGALDSSPKDGDKSTYQMDPANAREALRELQLDEAEGADMVMVKPAGAYLDIIGQLRQATALPLAAYQVSGEYLMIKAASASGWLDENAAILESLIAIKRAGADIILTYFATQAAELLKK